MLFRGLVPSLIGIVPYAGIDLAACTEFGGAFGGGLSFLRETKALLADETLRSWYIRNYTAPDTQPSTGVTLACAATAGMSAQLVAYPLSFVRTNLQANTKYRNMLDCTVGVYKVLTAIFFFWCLFHINALATPEEWFFRFLPRLVAKFRQNSAQCVYWVHYVRESQVVSGRQLEKGFVSVVNKTNTQTSCVLQFFFFFLLHFGKPRSRFVVNDTNQYWTLVRVVDRIASERGQAVHVTGDKHGARQRRRRSAQNAEAGAQIGPPPVVQMHVAAMRRIVGLKQPRRQQLHDTVGWSGARSEKAKRQQRKQQHQCTPITSNADQTMLRAVV